MLDRAAARGYKCIKSGAETALPLLPDNSVDYIVALSSLHFVEDFQGVLRHMKRVARKAIVLSIDHLEEDYLTQFACICWNHADEMIDGATDDYKIRGWTSPTLGMDIQTRMIYIPLN
eukprot:TRINITY_DN20414_c0_g1_i5.p1 TRINITY_DN20414_c0_g1~~TRINITY_DN20414_c0_g1_i5.p1  ORF type:complete len:118 (+),score=23.03 TRINITY_DN20414_c0_g1_i5:378-731(+)